MRTVSTQAITEFIRQEFTDPEILEQFVDDMLGVGIVSGTPWEMFTAFLAWSGCGNEDEFTETYDFLCKDGNNDSNR